MLPPPIEHHRVAEFLADRHGNHIAELRIRLRALRGGLCSPVSLVRASFHDRGKRRTSVFVMKALEGEATREAAVYRRLASSVAQSFSPKLLGVQQLGDRRCLLYIERVGSAYAWPWSTITNIARVLDCLALLHTKEPLDWTVAETWDYEAELQRQSRDLAQLAEELPRRALIPALARSLPALRRLVRALPDARRELLAFQPFSRAVIHGDVHPGNVAIQRRGPHHEPVLFDWGRTRVGSPLEDVSLWLEVLGCWEPEAKRRHDTLLAHYLAARGLPALLTRSLRDAYWLSAASNALAGSLLVHLVMSLRPDATGKQRALSRRAAMEWLRVVRRADACFC